jgi:hypothetical protein
MKFCPTECLCPLEEPRRAQGHCTAECDPGELLNAVDIVRLESLLVDLPEPVEIQVRPAGNAPGSTEQDRRIRCLRRRNRWIQREAGQQTGQNE